MCSFGSRFWIVTSLLGVAVSVFSNEDREYRLSHQRVAFVVSSAWSKGSAAPSDTTAMFQIPKQGSTRAELLVRVKPASSFAKSVQSIVSNLQVVAHIPSSGDGRSKDALILSRTIGGTAVVVDRLARRGPISVRARIAWNASGVTTTESQEWFVREANRFFSEITIDGVPIGAIGKLVERSDDRGALPTLDLQE